MRDFLALADLHRNYAGYLDKEIKVAGWVKTIRDQKSFAFITLSDGTCFDTIQIVVDGSLENYEQIVKIGNGGALIATGKLVKSPTGAKQSVELKATSIEIEGTSTGDYPLQPKRHSPEFLRTIAHLRPRANLFQAVFRVRSVLAMAVHEFFQERGFLYVHTPLITSSDCEGAGELFQVTTLDLADIPKTDDGSVDYKQDFFGCKTGLTVSGQLNGEAFAMAFRDIYTFGPTFRAEVSNTPRHVSEFWQIEPEMAFADLSDVMVIAEDMLKHLINTALTKCASELKFFNEFVDKGLVERLEQVVAKPFATITYTEAIEKLSKAPVKFEFPVFYGADLQKEHEQYIAEQIVNGPVFVTDYPKDLKSFYMRLNDDGKTVAAMDCLVPYVGELIGCSQREERLDYLQKRIDELGLDQAEYEWFTDLRRYGTARHSGFGLGFERLIMYVTGVTNIRDVIAFPRTPGNASF